jgi:hypothetical protein
MVTAMGQSPGRRRRRYTNDAAYEVKGETAWQS